MRCIMPGLWAVVMLMPGCTDRNEAPLPAVAGPLAVVLARPTLTDSVDGHAALLVLGTIGNGQATLTINGVGAHVAANGAFELLLPASRRPRTSLRLVATADGDTLRALLPLLVASEIHPGRRGIRPDTTLDIEELEPREPQTLRPAERVRVSARARAGMRMFLIVDAKPHALAPQPVVPSSSPDAPSSWTEYVGEFSAGALARGATLAVERGTRRAVRALPPVTLVDTTRRWVTTRGDGPVRASWSANGPPGWEALPGTVLEASGHRGSLTRVRLDAEHEGWLPDAGIAPLPRGAAPGVVEARDARVHPTAEGADVIVPMQRPVAFGIDDDGDRLEWRLFTPGNGDGRIHLQGDEIVRSVRWSELPEKVVSIQLGLAAPLLGYRVEWADGAMVLHLRRIPPIERPRPLRGRVITVDAGHPPSGAVGPRGIREADITLAVARRVRDRLVARGARVIMTRDGPEAVTLAARTRLVTGGAGEALVSIHADGPPDGVDPGAVSGSATFYDDVNPLAVELARATQGALVRELGLADRGITMRDLALTHGSWMPSVLCEGASLVVPEEEWTMSTEGGQERYARAIVSGLERFFGALATRGRVGGR